MENLPLVGGDPTRDAGEIMASALCAVGGMVIGVVLILVYFFCTGAWK